MEEKNDENKVDDKVKENGKKGEKKLGKTIRKKILTMLIPVISIVILVLLAAGIINVIPYLIKDWFLSLFGIGGNSAEKNVTLVDEINRIVCINEYGGYDIAVENFSKEILQKLEEQKVNNEAAEFITEDLEDMINKYIMAEAQTMYPKTDRKGDLDGLIKIQRASAETGEVKPLKYISYNEFLKDTSTAILDKFSINPETFDLCIATVNTTEYYEYNGTEEGRLVESVPVINKKEIEYQTSIQRYSMPFNFFLSLHMISQDADFMNELVNGVLDKVDPIVLTYIERTSVETIKKEYIGKEIITSQIETTTIEINEDGESIVKKSNEEPTTESPIDINDNTVSDYMTPGYYREVIISNSGTLQVTKADTWLEYVSKEINYVNSDEIDGGSSEKIVFEENNKSLSDILLPSEDSNYLQKIKRWTDIEIKEITTNTVEYKKYSIVNEKNETKEDDFIELIQSYPKVKNNLITAPSNLFYMLQQSETTQHHEMIMRYIIYRLNGIDYGVTDYPSYMGAFGFVNGMYGNTIEEKVWFALCDAGFSKYAVAGVMGNIYAESGFDPDIVEYGSGIGFGLCQWSYGRRTQLESYAESKGVEPSDVNTQIEFLITEITPGAKGPAEGYANYQLLSYNGYNGDMWENATSPEEAAVAFCWSFERPLDPKTEIREQKAREYYEKFKDMEKPTFSGEAVQAAGCVYPHYYQEDYPGPYGTSTIPKAGCGPTSLAMILAGLKGDPSINPYTVVESINNKWPDGSYFTSEGSSHCIFNNNFIQEYYGLSSERYPSQSEALQALENGYPVIGGEDGHILAIIPAPDEYKKKGYKFYILDSARGHDGPYKSVSDANEIVRGSLKFIAIIKP